MVLKIDLIEAKGAAEIFVTMKVNPTAYAKRPLDERDGLDG